MTHILGIDPGTQTGVALWNAEVGRFLAVNSFPLHRALEYVTNYLRGYSCAPVIFEDARQRQWFGAADERQRKYGAAIREGVGSVKRDCTIWEEFLQDSGVPYLARKPSSGSTKWKAEQFKRLTKWDGPTNEHGRDAGVLVYGFKVHEIASVVRSWEQARANEATRTQARRQ